MLRTIIRPFLGPSATKAEIALVFVPSIFAGLVAATTFWHGNSESGGVLWKSLLIGVLALDLVGGALTTCVPSGVRWWATKESSNQARWRFTCFHVVHCLVFAVVFCPNTVQVAICSTVLLVLGAGTVIWCAPHLKLAVGYVSFMAGSVVAAALVETAPGLWWFFPLFFLKIFVSHLPATFAAKR